MTPTLLRKIGELVEAGATVVGPPPAKSPGLSAYPECDAEVRELAARIWRPSSTRRATWSEQFKTPQKIAVTNELVNAKWIWHKEGNPAASAPPGERFFRRVITLGQAQRIAAARILVTADNSFELWVNGQQAGVGGNFKETYTFDIKRRLQPGMNQFAVKAVNGADYPNPAALIAAILIQFEDEDPMVVYSDQQWETAAVAPPNWLTDTAASDSWSPALELGPLGMQPWGELDKDAEPTYVFPRFESIAELLKGRGVQPDFVGDVNLRFIHRRDSGRDIYFVANSGTNWLQANCGFRISGKQPQIWNPDTAQINDAAICTESNGLTYVSLSFEPAGSLFVVFSEKLKEGNRMPFIDVVRDGRSLLPEPGKALPEAPVFEVSGGAAGEAQLLAWQGGDFRLKSGSGRERLWEVESLPVPRELSGSWEVSFQPKRGAPERLTLEQLIDWSQHPDSGVKYFSGTATYTKRFDMSPELCDATGLRQFLDLGSVAVMAQVTLNGKDLGILWKPPYRAEVTSLLRPTENRLDVKVVNLWVNRMIGDELLPEDSDRKDNGTLKQWPEWLQQDRPSPSGRYYVYQLALVEKGLSPTAIRPAWSRENHPRRHDYRRRFARETVIRGRALTKDVMLNRGCVRGPAAAQPIRVSVLVGVGREQRRFAHATTIFTSFFGTTMTFRMVLPEEWLRLLGSSRRGFELRRSSSGGDTNDVAQLAVHLDGDFERVLDEQRGVEAWPGGVGQGTLSIADGRVELGPEFFGEMRREGLEQDQEIAQHRDRLGLPGHRFVDEDHQGGDGGVEAQAVEVFGDLLDAGVQRLELGRRRLRRR